jgi:hypothetical protein
VMLGFEAEVPLHKDEEAACFSPNVHADARDVLGDELELAARVCGVSSCQTKTERANTCAGVKGVYLCIQRGCRCQ